MYNFTTFDRMHAIIEKKPYDRFALRLLCNVFNASRATGVKQRLRNIRLPEVLLTIQSDKYFITKMSKMLFLCVDELDKN